MTDEQFNAILAGASRASQEKLYRLSGLLTAALNVGNDATPQAVNDLIDWAAKVAYDVTRSQP